MITKKFSLKINNLMHNSPPQCNYKKKTVSINCSPM